jgi:hypothetical protein
MKSAIISRVDGVPRAMFRLRGVSHTQIYREAVKIVLSGQIGTFECNVVNASEEDQKFLRALRKPVMAIYNALRQVINRKRLSATVKIVQRAGVIYIVKGRKKTK